MVVYGWQTGIPALWQGADRNVCPSGRGQAGMPVLRMVSFATRVEVDFLLQKCRTYVPGGALESLKIMAFSEMG